MGERPVTAPALWTRNRPLALAIAREYRIPGADRDDVRQEALIGLWIASRAHRPERGPFPPFARMVVRRRLQALLKAALAEKHQVLTRASRDDLELVDGPEPDRVVVARDTLDRLTVAVASLPPAQRAAVVRIVNGIPYQGKADDTARSRARHRLRQELAA